MYILSQNKTRLINSECFREFAVVPGGDGASELHAVDLDDEPILLGVFHAEKHAVEVLEFLQHCLTDNEAKAKCTDIPSAEDAAFASKSCCSCEDSPIGMLRDMLRTAAAHRPQPADLEAMLDRLFN